MLNKIVVENPKTEFKEQHLSIYCGNNRVGSIWGDIEITKDIFERQHNIVYIENRGHRIATFWDCEIDLNKNKEEEK